MPKRRPAGPRRPLDLADPRRPAGARRPLGRPTCATRPVRAARSPAHPAGPATARRLAGVLPAVVAAVLVSGCAVADAGQSAGPAPTAAARTLRTPDTLLGLPRSGAPLPAGLPRFRLNELAREATPATSTVERTYGRGRVRPRDDHRERRLGPDHRPAGHPGPATEAVPDSEAQDGGVRPVRRRGPLRRGRTADEGHLTACAWADPEIAGVVVFLTATKQPDRKEDFLTVRDELEQPTG